jgi:F-box/leucine-rich repeat protein 7
MDFILEIAKKMHVRPFKRGDVIIKEGDVGKAMFFILRGSVSIYSGSDNDIVVGDMHSGSFFGEISMFFNIPRTATIVAKTRCLLAVLIGDELHKALENYPEIAEHIRIEAETRMQFVKARMEAKGRKTAQNGVVESEAFSSSRTIEQKLSDVSSIIISKIGIYSTQMPNM